jgi:hypothetical protein
MAQPTLDTAVVPKRLNYFERYLTVWVGLCMIVGVLVGKALPDSVDQLRKLEFGAGSQINIPIAVLIWLMIVPMMMKVDFTSIRNVGKKPRGLFGNSVCQLARKAAFNGVHRLAILPVRFRQLDLSSGCGLVHRGLHHSGRRPLYGQWCSSGAI